jgi:hypothetical protein
VSYLPPGPPPGPPPPPPPRKGHALEVLLGAVIGGVALPVLTVAGVAPLVAALGGGALLLGPGLLLAVGIGLMIAKETRPWGVGILIGGFVVLIVLGGACVAILAGLNATSG